MIKGIDIIESDPSFPFYNIPRSFMKVQSRSYLENVFSSENVCKLRTTDSGQKYVGSTLCYLFQMARRQAESSYLLQYMQINKLDS